MKKTILFIVPVFTLAIHLLARDAVFDAPHAVAGEFKLDGRLDDSIWKKAPVYEMTMPENLIEDEGRTFHEGGQVQFAWNKDYFYTAIRFVDSDVVAEGRENGLHHYQLGDLAELFMKPEDQTWYWELYATPLNYKTSFFFPGSGRKLPSCFKYTCGLKIAAKVDGTVNNWKDIDEGWTAEFRMPAKDLTAQGGSWGPGSKWCVFIGRYNYNRYLRYLELSSCPKEPKADFHLLESYARLNFKP
ncbi:MAG: carbohydrate-binding family 9-like protein [Verrucomicrobiae bacterium]|nr:carbohydrate-binding family 9-like protein [Verrucomicrobiae bacterium]